MKNNFRSDCPICSMLDIVGDKWSLLIIRDMLLSHKKTFKELVVTKESIVPSVLSARLKLLESFSLISKRKLPSNLKENIYLLTDSGIDLAPVIYEIVNWSDKNARAFNKDIPTAEELGLGMDKAVLIQDIKASYKEMRSGILAKSSSD